MEYYSTIKRVKYWSLVVKNPPANVGDVRVVGSIPGSGRSSGGGHGNPLQYFCLKNPMDRGNWWATVHRVTESQSQLSKTTTMKRLSIFILYSHSDKYKSLKPSHFQF